LRVFHSNYYCFVTLHFYYCTFLEKFEELFNLSLEIKKDLIQIESQLKNLETLVDTLQVSTVPASTSLSSKIFNSLFSIFQPNTQYADVILPLCTQAVVTGTILFLGTVVFHNLLREDFRTFITGVLQSNSFSNQIVREHVSVEHNETRELLLRTLSDLETFSKTLIEHNSEVQDLSVITVLNSLEKHSLIITKLLHSQNVIMSEQNTAYFEYLRTIHSSVVALQEKVN